MSDVYRMMDEHEAIGQFIDMRDSNGDTTGEVLVELSAVDTFPYCETHQALMARGFNRCWAADDGKDCVKMYAMNVTMSYLPMRYR